MEQAKAADGYLPKWRSNHLPRQRREGEGGKKQNLNFDDTAVLCCHPAAESGSAPRPFIPFCLQNTYYCYTKIINTECM